MTDIEAVRDDIGKLNTRVDGLIETMGELRGRVAAMENRKSRNGDSNGNGSERVNWKQILMIVLYLAAGGGGTATVMNAVAPTKETGMTRAEIIELIKAAREP